MGAAQAKDDVEKFKARNLKTEVSAVGSDASQEIEELKAFRANMISFIKEEEKREASERSYLPDPDLMRSCMDASGASFEVCMDALRDELAKTPDEGVALLKATATASKIDPKALEFVIKKGDATMAESVRAIREEGGEDGNDTLSAINRIMVNRRKDLEARALSVNSVENTSKNDVRGNKGFSKAEWAEKDKVACFTAGDWWEGVILRVIPRRTGTMYEVEFTDGSKQVVGRDCVKERDDWAGPMSEL
mmetsp:Transcript_9618/g.19565  ORF Transcript_9618/g.19565 Transcript_9618/m.19565 type:complete len:249 (-) Transcript_9618:172-918(-)